MPIWLRKFTFNSIQEFYLKEREEYNKAQSKYNKGKTNVKMDEGNKQKIPDFIKIILLILQQWQKILKPNIYNKIGG